MNSIISQNLGDNNSMKSPLTFSWIAIFSDGSKIEQFENNNEHSFQEVQNKINELVYFNLTDKQGHLFSVNVVQGLIGYNDLVFSYREVKEKKENVRLIFFRRHKVEITENNIEKSHNIEYHLGFQYNQNEYNRQIVLIIDSQGSWVLGE